MWAQEHCRISPPLSLAECCKKRPSKGSFVMLCFVLFAFSELSLVFVLSVYGLSSVTYFRACADVPLRIHSLNLWMMLMLVVQGRYRKTFQSGLFCRPCTKYPLHRLRLATTITTTSRRLVTKQKTLDIISVLTSAYLLAVGCHRQRNLNFPTGKVSCTKLHVLHKDEIETNLSVCASLRTAI